MEDTLRKEALELALAYKNKPWAKRWLKDNGFNFMRKPVAGEADLRAARKSLSAQKKPKGRKKHRRSTP